MGLDGTIFHEPWWLDIASDGRGQEAVVERGGHVVARLPYLLHKRFRGIQVIGMPALCHVLGPELAAVPLSGGALPTAKRLGLIQELLVQLPKASHVSFRLHAGVTETLAFASAGFHCEAEFTVTIRPAPREELWRQMRDKTRNVIRRAEERLTISETLDPDMFVDFYEENLVDRGRTNLYDRRIVRSLLSECLKRNAGRLLFAGDRTGMHSAILTVWDRTTEYYFMSTRRADAVNGAVNLLIWHALQMAAKVGRTFDMDGVHVVGGEVPNLLLLTGFGGCVVPRFYVRRSRHLIEICSLLASQGWIGKGG